MINDTFCWINWVSQNSQQLCKSTAEIVGIVIKIQTIKRYPKMNLITNSIGMNVECIVAVVWTTHTARIASDAMTVSLTTNSASIITMHFVGGVHTYTYINLDSFTLL